MFEDFSGGKCAYTLPPKKELPRESKDKLKSRRRKKQYQGVSRVFYPLKILGFIFIIISLGYVAVVQLKYLFFATSYFELKKIEVTGNVRLKKDKILTMAHVAPGLNIFKLDRDAIIAALLADPNIKDVKISSEGLYNLKIDITEHEILFYAKHGTIFLEISEDGTVIGSSADCNVDFPIITGLKLQSINAGDTLSTQDDFFVARTWIRVIGKKILSEISELNFSSVQNPYVYLASGEKVYPESVQKFKKQHNYLRALLDNLKKNGVEPLYLDLRAPGEIVIKPKKKKI